MLAQSTRYRWPRELLSELLQTEEAGAIEKIMAADGGGQGAAAQAAASAVAPEPGVQLQANQALQPALEEPAGPAQTTVQRCVICMDTAVQVVFMPCQHMSCCVRCTDDLSRRGSMRCPVCRGHVEEHILPFVVGLE